MPIIKNVKKRIQYQIITGLMVLAIVVAAFPSHVFAVPNQITNRKLTLQANGTTGGSLAGGTVNHAYSFTVPSVGGTNIGSIKFTYCTTADIANCVAPTGLTVQTATLAAGSSPAFTSFVAGASPYNTGYVTRTSAAVAAGTTVTITLNGVVNPTAANKSFYVGITTYSSTDTTGTAIDAGTVAASTANSIVLTGTMPESLIFCTGGTVTTTGGVPDCTTATSGAVTFNQLFSPTDTAYATSQMAASTNAGTGYSITVNGAALTSGGNTITGYNTTAAGDASVHGISKFGLNLKQNTTSGSGSSAAGPNFGAEIASTSNGTTLKGNPQTGYAAANAFRFVTGESVAKSDNGGSAGPTDAQIYTASYIANVSGSQGAGAYTTTLTYICTPTF